MQHEDDANNLGEHQHDVVCLARKGHAEENAEDIDWQEWDDGHLDSLLDDGAELREALFQRW